MKKKRSFSSLAVKVPLKITAMLLVVMCILSAVVITMSYRDSTDSVETEIQYLADLNASEVDAYLEKMNDFSHSLAKEVQHYQRLDRSVAEPILVETVKGVLDNDKLFGAYFAFEPNLFFPDTPQGLSYYAYRNGGTVSVDVLTDYNVYSTGDYYVGAKDSRQTYVTEPYPYELTNGDTVYLITLSTPVVDDQGVFLGVANCDILAESINAIDFYDGGYSTAYSTILTSGGVYVADSADGSRLGASIDATLPESQEILSALDAGEPLLTSGTNPHFGNKNALVAYIPIDLEGTNLHWTSGLIVNKAEAFASQRQLLTVILAVCLVSLLVLSALVVLVIRKALSPIPRIMHMAEKMQRCDLTEVQSDVALADDELGQLAGIFTAVSDDLRVIIRDINYCLNNMSNGNFSFHTSCEERYIGEYRHIIDDMRQIRLTLNRTLTGIGETADQVQVGSQQVADGSQGLAQGATEQASAVEELVATIAELSGRIQANADEAVSASALSQDAGGDVVSCNQDMQQLLTAMDEIQQASAQINKIIKVIDDIAFQTNILALNAAVEAARAGEAGKGFAVVADEVRNLAGKSAEAAKNTTVLISDALAAVSNGANLASATAASLQQVVTKAQSVDQKIRNIAAVSEEQSAAVAQISQGIDQISSVVQTNSATAEQSAAASEELSGQATVLKSMMEQFTLLNTDASSDIASPAEEAPADGEKY